MWILGLWLLILIVLRLLRILVLPPALLVGLRSRLAWLIALLIGLIALLVRLMLLVGLVILVALLVLVRLLIGAIVHG